MLDGLLVVALEQAVAAPLCTARLADAGARVIKIEREGGDTARHYDRVVKGTSAYFAWLNRGKESLVADLKTPADRALVRRMAERADVFVQNLAPGAVERLGLGADDLLAANPALIHLSIVGYAQDTPAAPKRAYDMLIQAESGVCAVTGTPETPVKVGVSIADIGAGMTAHAAVLEALIARGKTGRGRAITIPMFDVMADWMAVPLLHHDAGRETARHGLSHAAIYPYDVFPVADGAVVLVVQAPDEWPRLCAAIGRPDLSENPAYATNPERVAARAVLRAAIAGATGGFTFDALTARLDAARLAWARVSTVADVADHPALRRIEATVPGGAFTLPAPPLHPDAPVRAVPEADEHGAAIRAEFGQDQS